MAFLHYSFRPLLRWGALGQKLSLLAALTLGTSIGTMVELISSPSAQAQPLSSLASCEAPGPKEYLLLVVLQTDEAQEQLAQTLPPSVKAPTCNYLGSRVARMGGFKRPEDADAWASYLRDAASLPAFVAKPTARDASGTQQPPPTSRPIVDIASLPPANPSPPGSNTSPLIQDPAQAGGSGPPISQRPPTATVPPATTASPTVNPAPVTAASPSTYSPKALQSGYAVLVDYGNQTSLVSLLRQITKLPVGLVSYGQRPYLLVNYTPDSTAALKTMRSLTQSGFRAVVVESAQATLLTADVQLQ